MSFRGPSANSYPYDESIYNFPFSSDEFSFTFHDFFFLALSPRTQYYVLKRNTRHVADGVTCKHRFQIFSRPFKSEAYYNKTRARIARAWVYFIKRKISPFWRVLLLTTNVSNYPEISIVIFVLVERVHQRQCIEINFNFFD